MSSERSPLGGIVAKKKIVNTYWDIGKKCWCVYLTPDLPNPQNAIDYDENLKISISNNPTWEKFTQRQQENIEAALLLGKGRVQQHEGGYLWQKIRYPLNTFSGTIILAITNLFLLLKTFSSPSSIHLSAPNTTAIANHAREIWEMNTTSTIDQETFTNIIAIAQPLFTENAQQQIDEQADSGLSEKTVSYTGFTVILWGGLLFAIVILLVDIIALLRTTREKEQKQLYDLMLELAKRREAIENEIYQKEQTIASLADFLLQEDTSLLKRLLLGDKEQTTPATEVNNNEKGLHGILASAIDIYHDMEVYTGIESTLEFIEAGTLASDKEKEAWEAVISIFQLPKYTQEQEKLAEIIDVLKNKDKLLAIIAIIRLFKACGINFITSSHKLERVGAKILNSLFNILDENKYNRLKILKDLHKNLFLLQSEVHQGSYTQLIAYVSTQLQEAQFQQQAAATMAEPTQESSSSSEITTIIPPGVSSDEDTESSSAIELISFEDKGDFINEYTNVVRQIMDTLTNKTQLATVSHFTTSKQPKQPTSSTLFFPPSQISNIAYFPTVGDGQCFFHAVFGERNQKGVYRSEYCQMIRAEWQNYLKNFESLEDENMPIQLKEYMQRMLGTIFDQPDWFPEIYNNLNISELQKEVVAKIAAATKKSQRLKEKIYSNMISKKGNRTLLQKVLEDVTHDLATHLASNKELTEEEMILDSLIKNIQKRLDASQGDLTDDSLKNKLDELSDYKTYLCNKIANNLEVYANIYNADLNSDKFKKGYSIPDILTGFTKNPKVWEAYVQAIGSKNYWVFVEEIPILASIANKEIAVTYREAKGNYVTHIFYPDKETKESFEKYSKKGRHNADWRNSGDPKMAHIYHEGFGKEGRPGNHFSRANTDFLAKISTSQKSEPLTTQELDNDSQPTNSKGLKL